MKRSVSSDYPYPDVTLSRRATCRTRQPSDSGFSYGRPDSLPSPSISRAVYSYTDYGWDNYDRDDYGQDSYGQDSYGRDSYGQDSYGQDSYGRDSYGQDSYGRDSYGQDSYGQDSYGRDSYGQDSYGQDSYGQDSYGQNSYGQDSYGQDTGACSNPSYSPASSGHQTADEDTGPARQRHHGRASTQGDSPRASLTNGDDVVSPTNWAHYIFHPTDDGGYWKLRPEYAHTGESPSIPHHKSKSRTADYDSNEGDESASGYVCMWSGCDAKHFKRQADLQRHYTQRHVSEKARESWQCDHKKCARSAKGFGRLDHYRDHLRDYHKEDVCKRNSPVDDEWLRSRTYHAKWWRCSRCVIRVEVAKHPDHVCPKCKAGCEEQRKRARGLR